MVVTNNEKIKTAMQDRHKRRERSGEAEHA
jgi:hypothetical protein